MSHLLAEGLEVAAGALEAAAPELNRLDGYAGDGDLGVTMTEVARLLRATVGADGARGTATGEAGGSDGELLTACSIAVASGAPSTSGTLVATGFLRAAKVLNTGAATAGDDGITAAGGAAAAGAPSGAPTTGAGLLAECCDAALAGVMARGKAAVGDRTMVDGLDAVCKALHSAADAGDDWRPALRQAAGAAQAAAESTAAMQPKMGRASWVPERAAGHPDAGCTMLAAVFSALAAHFGGVVEG